MWHFRTPGVRVLNNLFPAHMFYIKDWFKLRVSVTDFHHPIAGGQITSLRWGTGLNNWVLAPVGLSRLYFCSTWFSKAFPGFTFSVLTVGSALTTDESLTQHFLKTSLSQLLMCNLRWCLVKKQKSKISFIQDRRRLVYLKKILSWIQEGNLFSLHKSLTPAEFSRRGL